MFKATAARTTIWLSIAGILTVTVLGIVSTRSTAAQPANCPTDDFINVSGFVQASGLTPFLNVTCTGDTITIQSSGIPNFEFVQITPNDLQAQNYTWEIPLNPTPAAQPTDIPLLGTVAVAVNGVPIFGPNEGGNLDFGDPVLDMILDYCSGHTALRGMYHFHARPDCLFTNMDGNPDLVVGYGLDGYPIMAPYACVDAACTQVQKVESSWQRTSDVRNAWEAHEYIAGSGDLDRCNGMVGADGQYRYYATDTFPYLIGCYYGEVSLDAVPGGQGQPPGQGQPDAATMQGQPPRGDAQGFPSEDNFAQGNINGRPPQGDGQGFPPPPPQGDRPPRGQAPPPGRGA